MNWTLPKKLNINGVSRNINSDFRDILDIIARLNDINQTDTIKYYVALNLFYNDFEEIPQTDYTEAINKMMWFITCGEDEPQNIRPKPKVIDWEQDWPLIVSDVNKVAQTEVRALPYCHWWTFISWFNGIGEGQLSTVVSIREKRRKGKKLNDWEREYYRENREKIDLKQRYTIEENNAIEQINKMLNSK